MTALRAYAAWTAACLLIIPVCACTSSSSADGGQDGGYDASLIISDDPYFDFASQFVGSSTDHAFTVASLGPGTAVGMTGLVSTDSPDAGTPFTFKDGVYPGTGGNCLDNLPAKATCTVVVTFAPTEPTSLLQPEQMKGSLLLTYGDGTVSGLTTRREIRGFGIAPALLSISDGPTYDFGSQPVGSSTSHAFTVTNTGGAVAAGLVIEAGASPDAGTSPFSHDTSHGGTCGTSLPPGGSCTLIVTYAPVQAGLASSQLLIHYGNGSSTQTAYVGIQGTGS